MNVKFSPELAKIKSNLIKSYGFNIIIEYLQQNEQIKLQILNKFFYNQKIP